MANAYSHFSVVSRSPKPVGLSSLFRGPSAGSSYDSSVAQQLQAIVAQLNQQSTLLTGLTKTLAGGSGAAEGILGGSVAGGLFSAGQSGFSWQSILKDVFPVGGLISGIAGLFRSTPTPPPLNEYDAPPSLGFNAVLGANGSLSQGSGNQYGFTRASSPGLDLVDAAGGQYSPYQRLANGSLRAAAGDATVRYPGTLNLPETMQSLVGTRAGTGSVPAAASSPVSILPAGAGSSDSGSVAGMGTSSDASGAANLPAFDKQWFDDHGSLIASAVRNQLLNYHPIVDAINDL
jgi:hypothetical protein